MRIIGGTHRGTALASVGKGDVSAHLRPTSDRVRESLFNVLLGGRYGDPVHEALVLDLFAGTGALGLEALSRGAAHSRFVDNGKVALRLMKENIGKLRRASDCTVLAIDAVNLPKADTASSLVFLDPPYGKGIGTKVITQAHERGWIAPGALIVWEENAPQLAPVGFDLCEHRRYGDTHVTLLRAQS